jgi:hypothetical protein
MLRAQRVQPLFEVDMSGRRSHPRYFVAAPWEGTVRVLRAVMIDRAGQNEFVAISHAAGVVGEEMSLDLIAAGARHELRVRVLASQPVIIENTLRHRIQLSLIASAETASLPSLASSVVHGAAESV